MGSIASASYSQSRSLARLRLSPSAFGESGNGGVAASGEMASFVPNGDGGIANFRRPYGREFWLFRVWGKPS